jgi:hypothetical protein
MVEPDVRTSPGPGVTDVTVPDVWFVTLIVILPVPVGWSIVIPEPGMICVTPVFDTTMLPVVDGIEIPAPAVTDSTAFTAPAIVT